MRFLYSIFVLFLLVVGNFAQQSLNSSDAPDLTVIKNKWHLRTQYNKQLSPTYPVYSGDDPEHWRMQIAENKTYTDRKNLPEIVPISVYEIKVKNTGRKTIRKVVWNYQFFKNGQSQPSVERTLYSFEKIKPNASKNLILPTRRLPFTTTEASEKALKSKTYLEKTVVKIIEYADGSIWKAN